MTIVAQEPPIDEFREAIERIADERIAETQAAYLSAIGASLGSMVHRIKAETGLSLLEFAKQHLSDKYDVIQIGTFGNVHALWPAGQQYLAPVLGALAEPKRPRFERSFWLAFALPAGGSTRWINPKTNDVFDGSDRPNEDFVEIPGHLIREDEDDYDVERIVKNIREWLATNGLAEQAFLARRSATNLTSSQAHSTSAGSSVLELMIAALDRKQQQSVSLSLDVVASLLRKRS